MPNGDLTRDALRLKEIDMAVLSAVLDGDFETLSSLVAQFRELKVSLNSRLAESSTINVQLEEAKILLQKLDSGHFFHADDVIAALEKQLNDPGCIQELTEDEINKLGSRLLYSWISHYDYVRDIFRINTLIIGVDAPARLQTYVSEAKNCYAFQQYNAVLALTRTILEAAAKDLNCRLGNLDANGAPIISIDPKVFNQLIGAVASGNLKKRATQIYYRACHVVHGDHVVTGHEAALVFKDTIKLTEELYAHHKF